MVIAMLYHRVLTPEIEYLDLDESTFITTQVSNNKEPIIAATSNDSRTKYLQGDYKLIQNLCQLLDQGQKAKKLADTCIDACSHLQNLREAIYDHKLRLESVVSSGSAMNSDWIKETEARGLHYLQRYFYLILFAEYLLEEATSSKNNQSEQMNKKQKQKQEQKQKQKLEKPFLLWLAERREITNLTQKSMSFD